VAIIDAEGLFHGDRLRRCSPAAQLHWPRFFLASNGFARIELNYAFLIGRAYSNFNPTPTREELDGYIREYVDNWLLFLYEVDGQLWGAWDTKPELLPRYKTSLDRRSPPPPEPEFAGWCKRYHEQKPIPKPFGNVFKKFRCGVGVGVGEIHTCASPNGSARESELFALIDRPRSEVFNPAEAFNPTGSVDGTNASALPAQQEQWFEQWWPEYWRHKNKKQAWQAFRAVRAIAGLVHCSLKH